MKLLNKFISILLIQTFILSNIAYAAPIDNASNVKAPKEITTDPEKVVIPREFGLVKSKFSGKGDRLIIHIQDAHCNFEAQSNIVKILENLSNNYSVNLISVEGADGVIDTTWFKAFPDDEVRKEVATYFMKKGEITGPEFLSITTDYPIKLFGAETRSYYIENLNAFTASYPLKDQTEKYFNNIKSALNRLKGFIYSEELKAMDEKVLSYESKKMQFNDYVRFLQDMAEKHKINLRQYDNFFKLVSALIYEKKIDFNVTDKERSALIDEISKKLSKDALTELVNQSIAFKVGKLSSAEYYSYLRRIAHDKEIDMYKTYPNLYNYIIYNAVYSRIENEELFNDIKKLEIAIKEKLFKNDDQRTLEKLSRHIDILIGLINIRLLNGDFDYYKANKDSFSYEVFSDFIKKKTIQYGLAYEIDNPTDAVAKSIEDLESFYKIAIKRDNALVDNTFNQMRKDKEKVAVLVTGGFHSEGITKILEKQKVSYMVICPNITKDVPSPYIQILTNQRTPLEEILVNSPTPEPKHGMLAPFSIAEAVGLRQDQLEKLSAMIKGAQTLKERTYGFEEDFVKRHVERWLEKAIRYAQSHQYRYDVNIMKRAYEIAMRNTLDRNIQEKGRIDGIMSQLLPAVMDEFDNIFERMSREGVSPTGAIEVSRENKLRDYIEDILDAIDRSGVSTQDGVYRLVVRMLVDTGENDLAHKIDLIYKKVGQEQNADKISAEIRRQTVNLSDIEIDIIRIAILGPGEGGGRRQEITMAEAYLSPRNFRDYNLARLRRFIADHPELVGMVQEYWALSPRDEAGKKTLAAKIKRYLADNYNVPLTSNILGFSLADLEESDIVNNVDSVEGFKQAHTEEYYARVREARDLILSGSVCRIELFAGLASRLFGDERSRDTSRSYAAHDVYEVAESVKYDLTKCQDRITGVSMATRIMVQEWIDIEKLLLQKHDKTAVDADIIKERKEVVWKTPRVIVINKESGESIIKEFIKNDFFGHNPELVVFVNQPTSKGFDVRSSTASIAEDSLSFPSGHAEATIQVVRPGAAFTIDKSGDVKVHEKNAMDYLMAKTKERIRLFTESRVNDMIRLGYVMNTKDEVLDPFQTDLDMMALALYRMGKYGEDAIFEQVKQDHKHPTKGGLLFEKNGWTGLIEDITQPNSMLEFAAGALQNRFYLYMTPKALSGMLKNGFPPYLTFRDGYLYVDTVTGDISFFKDTKAGFIGSDDRRLTDYKDSKKPLENGVNAAYRQDTNPVFIARLAELYEGAVEDVVLDLSTAPGFEPADIGAIRGKGGELTIDEHGTRGTLAESIRNEESVNGAIADIILREEGAYALSLRGGYIGQDKMLKEEKPKFGEDHGASIRCDKLIELMSMDHININFVVLKGLNEELVKRKVAPDLIFHPGIGRRSIYIDEEDLIFLLSLEFGHELVMEAVNHEIAHINNHLASEETIEVIAPSARVRQAILNFNKARLMDRDLLLYPRYNAAFRVLATYGMESMLAGWDNLGTNLRIEVQKELISEIADLDLDAVSATLAKANEWFETHRIVCQTPPINKGGLYIVRTYNINLTPSGERGCRVNAGPLKRKDGIPVISYDYDVDVEVGLNILQLGIHQFVAEIDKVLKVWQRDTLRGVWTQAVSGMSGGNLGTGTFWGYNSPGELEGYLTGQTVGVSAPHTLMGGLADEELERACRAGRNAFIEERAKALELILRSEQVDLNSLGLFVAQVNRVEQAIEGARNLVWGIMERVGTHLKQTYLTCIFSLMGGEEKAITSIMETIASISKRLETGSISVIDAIGELRQEIEKIVVPNYQLAENLDEIEAKDNGQSAARALIELVNAKNLKALIATSTPQQFASPVAREDADRKAARPGSPVTRSMAADDSLIEQYRADTGSFFITCTKVLKDVLGKGDAQDLGIFVAQVNRVEEAVGDVEGLLLRIVHLLSQEEEKLQTIFRDRMANLIDSERVMPAIREATAVLLTRSGFTRRNYNRLQEAIDNYVLPNSQLGILLNDIDSAIDRGKPSEAIPALNLLENKLNNLVLTSTPRQFVPPVDDIEELIARKGEAAHSIPPIDKARTVAIAAFAGRIQGLMGQTLYADVGMALKGYPQLIEGAYDLEAVVNTLGVVKRDYADNVVVIAAHDVTDINDNARNALLYSDRFIEKRLPGSFVGIRAEGERLVGEVRSKLAELRNQGKRVAVVASGRNITSETRSALLDIINMANTATKGREGQPMSALLELVPQSESRGDMPVSVIQALSLTIGFNLGRDEIVKFLNSVAMTADDNSFGPEAIDDMLRNGFIVLKPLRPVDWAKVDEAHKAEAAVLRSM